MSERSKSYRVSCSIAKLRFLSRIGLVASVCAIAALLPTNIAQAAQGNYGGIAYSPSTLIAAAGFAGNADDAMLAAVDACQAQSGASDCSAKLWFNQAYGSFARGDNGSWGSGWGTDAQTADAWALEECRKHGYNCQVSLRAHTSGVAGESGARVDLSIPPPPPDSNSNYNSNYNGNSNSNSTTPPSVSLFPISVRIALPALLVLLLVVILVAAISSN